MSRYFSCRNLLLLLLVLMTGYFSFYKLSESPPTWNDEGMILQLAENVADHGTMGLQLAPGYQVSAAYVSTGFPVVLPVALSFKLFSVGVLQGRVVAVLFIFLLLAAGLFLLTRLYGASFALWGVFLVATFSSLYGDGKNVLGEVPGLALLVLFLFFLQLLIESSFEKRKHALLAGLFLGLALATKPTFLPLIPAFLLALLLLRRQVSWKKGWIIAGFVGALAPVLVWLLTQFSFSDSLPQILSFYANPYHLTNLHSIILTNALRFFKEATPLYTLLTFGLWAVALGVRKYKKSGPTSIPELVAFFFTVLILLAYLRTPGWYRYLFPANILTLLFLPTAIRTIVETFTRKTYAVAACITVLLAFQTYHMVFDSWVSGTSASTNTAALTTYFDSLPAGESVFVYDTPEVVPFLKTTQYWQYFSGNGVWVAGSEYLQTISKGTPDIVVVSDSNLFQVQQLGGNYHQVAEIVGRYIILGRR